MELTPEIIAEAKQVAETHKLKEVFVTEKGEFFSSAREARNSKAKEVLKAYTVAEEVQETEALGENLVQETGASNTDLDTDSTKVEGANDAEKEEVTTTITEPEDEEGKSEEVTKSEVAAETATATEEVVENATVKTEKKPKASK